MGLETPQADGSAMTLLDVLEGFSEAEDAEERIQTKMLDLLDSLEVTSGEAQCVPYLRRAILGEDDAVAPRALRVHSWSLRKNLRIAWENAYGNGF